MDYSSYQNQHRHDVSDIQHPKKALESNTGGIIQSSYVRQNDSYEVLPVFMGNTQDPLNTMRAPGLDTIQMGTDGRLYAPMVGMNNQAQYAPVTYQFQEYLSPGSTQHLRTAVNTRTGGYGQSTSQGVNQNYTQNYGQQSNVMYKDGQQAQYPPELLQITNQLGVSQEQIPQFIQYVEQTAQQNNVRPEQVIQALLQQQQQQQGGYANAGMNGSMGGYPYGGYGYTQQNSMSFQDMAIMAGMQALQSGNFDLKELATNLAMGYIGQQMSS